MCMMECKPAPMADKTSKVTRSPKAAAMGVATLSGLMRQRRLKMTMAQVADLPGEVVMAGEE